MAYRGSPQVDLPELESQRRLREALSPVAEPGVKGMKWGEKRGAASEQAAKGKAASSELKSAAGGLDSAAVDARNDGDLADAKALKSDARNLEKAGASLEEGDFRGAKEAYSKIRSVDGVIAIQDAIENSGLSVPDSFWD